MALHLTAIPLRSMTAKMGDEMGDVGENAT